MYYHKNLAKIHILTTFDMTHYWRTFQTEIINNDAIESENKKILHVIIFLALYITYIRDFEGPTYKSKCL